MIYIDRPREIKGEMCCHMVADTLEELHEYALHLGILRRFFQNENGLHPHYDVWGFALSQVEKRAENEDGVMFVSDNDLLLIAHNLLINSNCHGNEKSNKEVGDF